MHILIGILLILSLSFLPAPETSDGAPVRGSVSVVTGTQGTQVGLQFTTDGNPSVTIGFGQHIPAAED